MELSRALRTEIEFFVIFVDKVIIARDADDHLKITRASGETTKPLSKVRGENTQD